MHDPENDSTITDTLLNRGTKLFTADELLDVNELFINKFKHRKSPDGALGMIQSTEIRIALSSIHRVENELLQNEKKPARGIHFKYGMDGDTFCPVIQFMYADDNARGDLSRFDAMYEVRNEDLAEIGIDRCNALTEAYKEEIRILQAANGEERKIILDPPDMDGTEEPDPLAEWFSYADNVNRLIRENPGATHLLVVCISEKLPYQALANRPGNWEYRHMLALLMADEQRRYIGNDGPTRNSGYAEVAMDLGHLCPPRCSRP